VVRVIEERRDPSVAPRCISCDLKKTKACEKCDLNASFMLVCSHCGEKNVLLPIRDVAITRRCYNCGTIQPGVANMLVNLDSRIAFFLRKNNF
jgi:hypothetical protein